MMKKENKLHYGWRIIFACFMLMSFYFCVVMNCPGLFLTSVTQEFGISRSQYTLNTTVISIAMMIVSLNAGKIFSKFKIKSVMRLAGLVLPIAYAGYSIAPNIRIFYGISLVVGFSLGLCGMVPMSTLITRWFNDKKGLATGLAFTGSGLGGVVLQPVIGQLIEAVGWRKTYFAIAVIMFVFVYPCIMFLIKDYPSDKGLEPVGGLAKTENNIVPDDGIMLSQARKKAYFWMYLPLVAISCAAACSMIQQIVPYATDIGYDPTVAANIGALNLGTLAVAKIILGKIYDTKGNLAGTVTSLLALAVALVLYYNANSPAILYLGIIFAALGIAYTSVGFPINTQTMFGKKDYSAVYGVVFCFSSVGTAIGSPITSMIFDATGSYRTAWLIWGALIVLTTVIYIIIDRISAADRKKSSI